MGAFCSCFHVPDGQHNTDSDDSSSGDCLCPKCLFQNFVNKHANLFPRGPMRAICPPIEVSSSSSSSSSSNSDVGFKNSRLASGSHDGAVSSSSNLDVGHVSGSRDGAGSNGAINLFGHEQCHEAEGRQEKGTSSLEQPQPEPVKQNDDQVTPKSIRGDKMGVSSSGVGSQDKKFSSRFNVNVIEVFYK